jgi:hypothetical protein
MFGGTEEIGIGQGLSNLGKLMPELSAISGQVMKARKDEEADQAGICFNERTGSMSAIQWRRENARSIG